MKLMPLEYTITRNGKKRAKLMSRRERQEIGEYIRQSLGLLFVNIVKSLDEREERERNFKNQMAKPLE